MCLCIYPNTLGYQIKARSGLEFGVFVPQKIINGGLEYMDWGEINKKIIIKKSGINKRGQGVLFNTKE